LAMDAYTDATVCLMAIVQRAAAIADSFDELKPLSLAGMGLDGGAVGVRGLLNVCRAGRRSPTLPSLRPLQPPGRRQKKGRRGDRGRARARSRSRDPTGRKARRDRSRGRSRSPMDAASGAGPPVRRGRGAPRRGRSRDARRGASADARRTSTSTSSPSDPKDWTYADLSREMDNLLSMQPSRTTGRPAGKRRAGKASASKAGKVRIVWSPSHGTASGEKARRKRRVSPRAQPGRTSAFHRKAEA
jgi:hypothetical protein